MACAWKRADLGVVIALTLGLGCPAAALAQTLPKTLTQTPGDQDAVAAPLQPGEFVWRPDAAPSGPLTIKVSIPRQLAYVYRGGALIGVSTVSTGRPGHETPTGSYTILQKAVMHHSNLYNDAAMPFMERLTWDGLALHAGHNPGRPASHGCVRLPIAFAKKLYGVTALGATVLITDEDAAPDATMLDAGAPDATAPDQTAPSPPAPAEIALAPTEPAPDAAPLAVTRVSDRAPGATMATVQAP